MYVTRALVVVGTCVAVLVGGGVGAAAVPPTPAPTGGSDGPAKSAVSVSKPEAATEAEALDQARFTGERVEVLSARTEWDSVYAEPSGEFTWESTTNARRTRLGSLDGEWRSIDTTLQLSQEGLRPVAPVYEMVFSRGGVEPLARIRDGEHEFVMTWPSALPEPVLSGDQAIYTGVLPGVDLVVGPTEDGTGFSEVLVVHSPEAAANPALAELSLGFEVSSGLDVAEVDGGGFVVSAADDAEVFTSAAPVMWDSSGDAAVGGFGVLEGDHPGGSSRELSQPLEGDRVVPVGLSVAAKRLSLIPDAAMLSGAETSWPVYIDPTVSASRNEWTMIQSCCTSADYKFTGDNGVGLCDVNVVSSCNYVNKKRLVWEFGFPSAARGAKVTKAELAAYQTHAYDCDTGSVRAYRVNSISSSTNWSSHHAHWDNTDLMLDSVNETRKSGCPLGPGWTRWDVTAGAQLAADNSWSTLTLGVRAANETSMAASWKRFRYDATLSITYNSYPNKPTRPSLNSSVTYGSGPNDYIVRDLTPTLYSTVSDPDSGQTVRGRFEVFQGSTKKWSGETSLFASGTKVSITVPSGKLAENILYTVKVWAKDSGGLVSKSSSDTIQFKIDVTPPNAKPGVTPVAGQPGVYVENEWAGGVGRLGKFTFTNGGVSDVKSYKYSFNSDGLGSSINAGTSSGGPATVSFTPTRIGPQTLYVQSVDQVGLTGPVRLYRFNVEFPRAGAWWPFNEGSGTAATDNVAGTVLSLTGTSWVDGPLAEYGIDQTDRALSFSGSTSSHAATSGPLIGTEDSFSVMAWVKAAELPSNYATAVAQDGTTDYGFKLGITSHSSCPSELNGFCWGFWSTNAPVGGGVGRALSTVPVEPDSWVQLTGIYDAAAGQMQLYVCPAGGEPVGSAVKSHTIGWTATGPLRVGLGKTGSSLLYPWKGAVDEVRLYDSVVDLHMLRRACQGDDPGAPNEMPTAAFDVSCEYLTCTFDAARSNDPDGTLTGYQWDFGDGTPAATGATVQHTFNQPGTYTVTLTVTDDRGGQGTTTNQVGGPTVLELGPLGYAQTADHSALDITGAIDIRIDVEPETWTPGERQVLASKGNYYGDLSWALTLSENSSLSFLWSFNGTTNPLHHVLSFPTEGIGRKTVRVTLTSDGAGGAYVDFYIGNSISGPWEHKGRHHRIEPPTIYASNSPLRVGGNPQLWWPEFAGKIYRVQVRNGVGGSLAANPNFTSLWPQQTSFVDSAGRTWTLSADEAEVVFQ